MPKAVFRTDSAPLIGTKHRDRCLILAHLLKDLDWEIVFVCRKHTHHSCKEIKNQGFEVRYLVEAEENFVPPPTPPHAEYLGVSQAKDCFETQLTIADLGPIDLLIVDHEGIDRRWEEQMFAHAETLMILDDLADRPHHAHILVDSHKSKDAYRDLVSPECNLLCGEDFIILPLDILKYREMALKQHQAITGSAKILLIDSKNHTANILDMLEDYDGALNFKVFCAANSAFIDKLEFYQFNYPHEVEVVSDPAQYAEAMMRADIAFAGENERHWSRICLGLPTLSPTADKERILDLIENADKRKILSQKAAARCDGRGVERISEAVFMQRDFDRLYA